MQRPTASQFNLPILNPYGNVFPQQVTANVNYGTQLTQMKEMGFVNEEVNLDALKVTNGNVNAAVERILNMIH